MIWCVFLARRFQMLASVHPRRVHLLYGREPYPNEHATVYYYEKAKGGTAITCSAL